MGPHISLSRPQIKTTYSLRYIFFRPATYFLEPGLPSTLTTLEFTHNHYTMDSPAIIDLCSSFPDPWEFSYKRNNHVWPISPVLPMPMTSEAVMENIVDEPLADLVFEQNATAVCSFSPDNFQFYTHSNSSSNNQRMSFVLRIFSLS